MQKRGEALVAQMTLEEKASQLKYDAPPIYMKDLDSVYATRGGELCGFARVTLEQREKKTVTLNVDKDAFTVIDDNGKKVVDGKHFQVSVGFGQPDERTRTLTGKKVKVFSLLEETK